MEELGSVGRPPAGSMLFDALRANRVQFIVLAILVGALYLPILSPMFSELYSDPNYSHGLLVPFISGYFLYRRLDELKAATVKESNWGLPIVIFGIFLLIVSYVGTEYFTMRSSFIVVLAGLVVFFLGYEVFKASAFSIAYLFFMVPLPYLIYDSIAFPLKLMVSKYSVIALKAMGIIVWREGNIIMFPNIELEVADACSGIRSLMSLIALTVAFAYIFHKSNPKRVILVLSAIPVAILANGLRVISTGILAQHWGAAAAEGFFHEFAGFAVFALAILIVLMIGALLRRLGGE